MESGEDSWATAFKKRLLASWNVQVERLKLGDRGVLEPHKNSYDGYLTRWGKAPNLKVISLSY